MHDPDLPSIVPPQPSTNKRPPLPAFPSHEDGPNGGCYVPDGTFPFSSRFWPGKKQFFSTFLSIWQKKWTLLQGATVTWPYGRATGRVYPKESSQSYYWHRHNHNNCAVHEDPNKAMWWVPNTPHLSWQRAISPRDIIDIMSDDPGSIQQENEDCLIKKNTTRSKGVQDSARKSTLSRKHSNFKPENLKKGQLDYQVFMYHPPHDQHSDPVPYSVKAICQVADNRSCRYSPAHAVPRFDSFNYSSSNSSCCHRSESRCSCRQLHLKVLNCNQTEPVYDRVVSWLELFIFNNNKIIMQYALPW